MVEDTGSSENRERDESGQYAPGSITTVTEEDVIAAVQNGGHIVTATEVAESVGTSRDTALRRLRSLYESGEIERRDVGSGTVWWPSDP